MTKSKRQLSVFFLLMWAIFQMAYSFGVHYQHHQDIQDYLSKIELRIALDLPKLKLANPKFNTAADPDSIQQYLQSINTFLGSLDSPVSVNSLQGIALNNVSASHAIQRTLYSTDQNIELGFISHELNWFSYVFAIGPLLAMLLSVLYFLAGKHTAEPETPIPAVEDNTVSPRLVLNLKNKTIHFGQQSHAIHLSNKPFCFYAALLDYSVQTDAPNLKHSADVPEELLQIANKYFYRLIDLGHTKRKRPDFAANLDKTLSEIRSALDEVFKYDSEHKELFYPPKAQGEGSRSKMHNYAILNNDPRRLDIIGK